MSEKKWIRNSLRKLSDKLDNEGYQASRSTLRRLLKPLGFGLYSNRKSISPNQHPERDRQFRYINKLKSRFLKAGYPVISVDTKKKELIGHFAKSGQTWGKQARAVNTHDFPADASGRAVPYGIYDLANNQGYILVGNSADTAEFAVEAIRSWWQTHQPRFLRHDKWLILCDSGGSNSCRSRLWRLELQKLADELDIEIVVCHYPTGASKWNPVEHRLFSYISINWAGRPLYSFDEALGLIRNTTTSTGLTVTANLIDKVYETGRKVTDPVFKTLNIVKRQICPQWNYRVSPRMVAT